MVESGDKKVEVINTFKRSAEKKKSVVPTKMHRDDVLELEKMKACKFPVHT
jgi:hypothetical protein